MGSGIGRNQTGGHSGTEVRGAGQQLEGAPEHRHAGADFQLRKSAGHRGGLWRWLGGGGCDQDNVRMCGSCRKTRRHSTGGVDFQRRLQADAAPAIAGGLLPPDLPTLHRRVSRRKSHGTGHSHFCRSRWGCRKIRTRRQDGFIGLSADNDALSRWRYVENRH